MFINKYNKLSARKKSFYNENQLVISYNKEIAPCNIKQYRYLNISKHDANSSLIFAIGAKNILDIHYILRLGAFIDGDILRLIGLNYDALMVKTLSEYYDDIAQNKVIFYSAIFNKNFKLLCSPAYNNMLNAIANVDSFIKQQLFNGFTNIIRAALANSNDIFSDESNYLHNINNHWLFAHR